MKKNRVLQEPANMQQLADFDWRRVRTRFLALGGDVDEIRKFPALDLARALGVLFFIQKKDPGTIAKMFGKTSCSWPYSLLKILHFDPEVQAYFSADREFSERLPAADANFIFEDPRDRQLQAAQDLLKYKQRQRERIVSY